MDHSPSNYLNNSEWKNLRSFFMENQFFFKISFGPYEQRFNGRD